MDIDFGQIITQIIAFLLMLWVLKKFAWGPLMEIMDNRSNGIKDEFAKIEQEKEALKQRENACDAQLLAMEEKGREIIEEAVKQGRQVAQEIQQDTQLKAKDIIKRAQEETKRELAKTKERLKIDLVHLGISIFEKLAKTKLSEKDNEILTEKLIDEANVK
jgi:F-type H+-transporting ATPase subunit b